MPLQSWGGFPSLISSEMTTEAAVATDSHDHEHHDHPAWLAHHFDDAQQQFDAGKFGMWMFLVTEVLFFSGMFCAYVLFRNRNPEVFEYCSSFLNTKLGAINTGVLLFSSLTMAWAVRAAQLKQHTLLVGMLGATLGCAAIFLGVKAVEYTHKWELGLLPGKMYVAQMENAVHADHQYLQKTLIVPLIYTVIGLLYYLYSFVISSRFHRQVAGPVFVSGLCFFAGVFLGQILESGDHGDHGSHAAHATADGESAHHGEGEAHAHASDHTEKLVKATTGLTMASDVPAQLHPDVFVSPIEQEIPRSDVNNQGMAGLFFSIYYCMTGVHAVHILAGMGVIVWMIVKAARHEFHSQYFGPVDNVGLYWHLVDFIWIYLFPLLYLIT
jgi:cytochrome c oxidase subunit 3